MSLKPWFLNVSDVKIQRFFHNPISFRRCCSFNDSLYIISDSLKPRTAKLWLFRRIEETAASYIIHQCCHLISHLAKTRCEFPQLRFWRLRYLQDWSQLARVIQQCNQSRPYGCLVSWVSFSCWEGCLHCTHNQSWIYHESQSMEPATCRIYLMNPETLASSILSACSTSLKEALPCASREEKAHHRSELAQKVLLQIELEGREMKTDRCKSSVCRFNVWIHEFASHNPCITETVKAPALNASAAASSFLLLALWVRYFTWSKHDIRSLCFSCNLAVSSLLIAQQLDQC